MGLRVLAIDSGDEKRELCKKIGAEEWIDFKHSKDIVEDIKARCGDGLGPHVAVITSPIVRQISCLFTHLCLMVR
jgi:propanol-preferring alcohol dehydrogenase